MVTHLTLGVRLCRMLQASGGAVLFLALHMPQCQKRVKKKKGEAGKIVWRGEEFQGILRGFSADLILRVSSRSEVTLRA